MQDNNTKLQVNIFGNNFTLVGAANPEYLLRVAKYVDAKMKEMSNTTNGFDMVDLAVLTAVNICSELFTLREESQQWKKTFHEKSESLIKILDKTLQS